MYTTHTRRGNTQEVKHAANQNKCHSRGFLSGISTALNNQRGGDPRLQTSGMTPNLIPPHPTYGHPLPQGAREMARGFTLIELLVVILIIGLLAAVALPQYQKAVRKARMADVATTFNAISRAVNTWLLENSPKGNTSIFLGTNANATLPIDIPCDEQDVDSCINKSGSWRVSTSHTGSAPFNYDHARIARSKGNSNLNVSIYWEKDGYTGPWVMDAVSTTDDKLRQLVCQWWIENYGVDLLVGTAKREQCQ